jgi:hypothetical protein
MRTKCLVSVFALGLGLTLAVLFALSGPSTPAQAQPAAWDDLLPNAPSVRESERGLPPGATAEWWAAVQEQLRQEMAPQGASALVASRALTLTGENQSDSFGYSAAWAGDVNSDGYADVVAGAFSYNSRGKAYVYHGSAAGLSATPAFTATGFAHAGSLGSSLASAGDVNGDGFADIVVGASGDLASTGRVYVYAGGGDEDGRTVRVRQMRGDGTPVQPWGFSHAGGAFRVRMNAGSIWGGRAMAKLQVEACPPGAPFGSAACRISTSPTWARVGPRDVALSVDMTDLNTKTLYRWRARCMRCIASPRWVSRRRPIQHTDRGGA